MRKIVASALLVLLAGLAGAPNAPAQKAGGTLTVASDRHPTLLHPAHSIALPDLFFNQLLYDALIVHDDRGQIQPLVAKKWEVSPDGKGYTFTLRDDIRFQTGNRLTAKDVKAHFDRWKKAPTAAKLASLDRVEVVDDQTVRMVLKNPNPGFLLMISANEWGYSGIPENAVVEKLGSDYGTAPDKVSGSGPFRLTEWLRGDRLTVVRNPSYRWGTPMFRNTGPAHLERIVYRTIPEAATRTAELETKGIDVNLNVAVADAKRVKAITGVNLIVKTRPTIHHFGFNHRREVFKDVRVRRAFIHAVDQGALVEAVFQGFAEVPQGILHPSVQGASPAAELKRLAYAYDPARARALLDEAGWKPGAGGIRAKDGKLLKPAIYVYAEWQQQLATVLQAQLREVGVDSEIRSMDFAAWKKATESGEHDLRFIDGSHTTADILYWFTCAAQPYPNNSFWCDRETDDLFKQAQEAGSVEGRVKAFQQMEQRLLDQAALIMMPHTAQLVGTWSHVKGTDYFHPVHGFYKFVDLWLDR